MDDRDSYFNSAVPLKSHLINIGVSVDSESITRVFECTLGKNYVYVSGEVRETRLLSNIIYICSWEICINEC